MGEFYTDDVFQQLETFEKDVYTIESTKNVKRATVLFERLRNRISNIMSYKSIYLNLSRSRARQKAMLACEQGEKRRFHNYEYAELTPAPTSSPKPEFNSLSGIKP